MAGRSSKAGLLGSAPGVTSQHHGEDLNSRVFVANVPVELVEKLNLHSRFSKYGIVTEVIIHRKGFAFVQFKNRTNALAAIQGESGTYLEGRKITCQMTKNKRLGPPGPRTQTGKEIVIGESDDSSSNGGEETCPSSRNWSSQNGSGQELKQSVAQSEQDWDASDSPSPLPHTPARQSSSDHSLTLGLFVKNNKKASKLAPFKKTAARKEKSPEKSSATPLNTAALRSSVFESDKCVSSTGDNVPEAGPFEELWDSEFSDDFKNEGCIDGDGNTTKTLSLEKQVPNRNSDEVWDNDTSTVHEEQKSVQTNTAPKVAVEVPASMITPSQSPSKAAVVVEVPASLISPSHSALKAPVEVQVPSSLINTSAKSEKSVKSEKSDGRPIDNSGNNDDGVLWDDDSEPEPPFVIPTGKQELHSSTDGSANKWKTPVPPVQHSKDVRVKENWDEEEIDVVSTPPPDPVLSRNNKSKDQDEALWDEEVDHVEAKGQSATDDRVDHVPTNAASTSTARDSVPITALSSHSNEAEKKSSGSQADKPPIGISNIQNPGRIVDVGTTASAGGLTSLGFSTRVMPAAASVATASMAPAGVPVRVMQSQPLRTGPPMTSNYLVPVGQTTMTSVGQPAVLGPPPPSAIHCDPPPPGPPPPGPPPIPPPQPQQTYSSVPSMVPVRATPNITYGSLFYPSRRIDGPVGGYMAYNVSMGGQPMYQQGQPVGHPPMPTSSNQMMSPPVETQRQRHMSGPPAPVYIQNQVETYRPPPPPSPGPSSFATSPGPSNYAPPTPPSPGPSNYAPPTPPSPVQRERHLSGPTMPYQEQQGGQTVSRMSTTYLASSHPYDTGMKNLSMSASVPLEQQMGYKRDPSFPLTDIEKGRINSEFQQALQTAGGPLDVTDNTILRIYMVLPEPIRRGIKRMGGLKTYFEQSECFDVRGDLVGLPGQIKRTPVTIQPPPGWYQPRKSGSLSSDAAEFVPGEQRSRSSSTSSSYSTMQEETSSNLKSSTFGTASSSRATAGTGKANSTSGSPGSGRVGFGSSNPHTRSVFRSSNSSRPGFGSSTFHTTSGTSGSTRSGFSSSQDTSNKGFASMPKFGARQESVSDNVKDLQRTASMDETGDSKEKEKTDKNVYTLVKDEPVEDDLWELDSFLTEAYGGGYYQDYLALSKELEKQSSQATRKTASKQDKSQTTTSQDSSQSIKVASVQSEQSGQGIKATATSAASSSIEQGSSHDEAKQTKGASNQTKDSTAQIMQTTSITVKPTQDDTGQKDATTNKNESSVETTSKSSSTVENTCQADVIDPRNFEKKTATTFAAKLLEAASIHAEDTCERVDGRAAVSGKDLDVSDKSKVVKVEKTDEEEYVEVEKPVLDETVENAEEKTSGCETTEDGRVVEEKKADAAADKDDTSESSWNTISDDSPRRLSKLDMVDQYVGQVIAKEMAKVASLKPSKPSKSKGSDTGSHSESDVAVAAGGSSGVEGVKLSSQKKVRCAAVFNAAQEPATETGEEIEKPVVNSSEAGDTEVKKALDTKISKDEELAPNAKCDDDSPDTKVEEPEKGDKTVVEGPDTGNIALEEVIEEQDSDDRKGEKVDTDDGTDVDLKTVEREVSEDLGKKLVVDEEKADIVQDEKIREESDSGTLESSDAPGESGQGLDSDKDTIVKPESDVNAFVRADSNDKTAVTEADFPAVDPDTTGEQDETFYLLKDDDNDISTDITEKTVQDSLQVDEKSGDNAPKDENCTRQDELEERPRSPIHEEIIQESKVTEVNVKEYLASAAAKQDRGSISIGVNTDQVKTVHRGIVTSKVPKMSRVTNTVAVPTTSRCVGTFEDFEQTYYQKNIELENQIRLLEENLEDERDQATLQKHSFQVEVRTLKDQLETLSKKKNEVEDQLKIRKRQQASEMRKTTAELRDTDARYSAQKSKVTALEKENACITKELSAVTRELFDLQAIMEAETIRKRTQSIDETTSTDELEEVQRQFERQMELEKEQRENELLEKVKEAELKILKMQLDNCQKSMYKIQEQSQQTYSIYANSPQISTHEKLYVNRQWSSYQNQIQEVTDKLLVDYEHNELLLKEGATLAELTPLEVSHLEPFTPRTSGPSSSLRRASSPSAGFTIPSASSQQPTERASSRGSSSALNVGSSDTISDAGLDELKDMTSRLLQPDVDLSKPTPSMPNLAGSAPLFSLGSLGSQQSNSAHHPYTRQSREDRLRCIQRRLGLNPDTGKPFASRSINKSTASSSSNTAVPSDQTSESIAAAKASAAVGNPLLVSSAFNFAMKQRSLAAQSKSQPNLPTSLASTYKKHSQSSSSKDTTTASTLPQQPFVPPTGIPASSYQDYSYGVTPRARSLSSPSAASQPQAVSTQFSYQPEAAIPTSMTETSTVLPEPSNVEGFVEETKNDYEQSTGQYQYQEVDYDSQAGTTASSNLQESEVPTNPPNRHDQSETTPFQTDVYQSESEYFSSPKKTDKLECAQQQQEQYYQEQQQEEQQSSQEQLPEQGSGPHNESIEEEYEITYVFTDDKLQSPETDKKKSYMQLDSVEASQAAEPVSASPSIESSSRDNSQPQEPHHKPEPAPVPSVPQFPKSEAIQATRSKSPTDDLLGQRWDDLPSQLKSGVVPRMTRSGGVTLKAIGRSQSEETGSKTSGGGKRKGAAWGGASNVGGLAPIDDEEDGWTTVISKRKKKALDIVEQQQQQQQQKLEAPKPLSKGSRSLDKIHSALARQFPGITRKEVMDTMKRVRIDHCGSLSGVSMAVLVKEASSHIKNTNPKYMISKPMRHEECDDICVICQDDLRVKPGGSTRGGSQTQADIRMLDCGHVFHDDCLKVWYDTRERTCPMCR